MSLLKHPWLVYFALGALAIAATIVGESYKIAWALDWVAPILLLVGFVSLSTLSHRPDALARTRADKFASYAKTTAFAGLIFLFTMIEIVSDAPVKLRLMGMSMTMSGQAASRFLVIGGLVIGAIGIWMTMIQARREATAAALAKSASGQARPASDSTT
ncbi:MAG: hypothetical protein WC718_18425 [Phycisphaerales bacterium]